MKIIQIISLNRRNLGFLENYEAENSVELVKSLVKKKIRQNLAAGCPSKSIYLTFIYIRMKKTSASTGIYWT